MTGLPSVCWISTRAGAKATADAIAATGDRALAVAVDVSDADAVQTAVDRVAAELGTPTVLVNNAGSRAATCCSS